MPNAVKPTRKLHIPPGGGAWSRVDVGDDLFIGSTEGGFFGLEEYRPSARSTPDHLKQHKPDHREAKDSKVALSNRRSGQTPDTDQPTSEHTKDARIIRRKRRKVSKAGSRQVGDLPDASKASLHTELAEQEVHASENLSSGLAPDITPVTAWNQYGLDGRLLHTLAELGFSAPTPIQQECLPSAVRDKRDIIGAAQTVIIALLDSKPCEFV